MNQMRHLQRIAAGLGHQCLLEVGFLVDGDGYHGAIEPWKALQRFRCEDHSRRDRAVEWRRAGVSFRGRVRRRNFDGQRRFPVASVAAQNHVFRRFARRLTVSPHQLHIRVFPATWTIKQSTACKSQPKNLNSQFPLEFQLE